jgi:hypothetical protein
LLISEDNNFRIQGVHYMTAKTRLISAVFGFIATLAVGVGTASSIGEGAESSGEAEATWFRWYTGHGNVHLGLFTYNVPELSGPILFALDRLRDNPLPFYLYNGRSINAYSEVANYVSTIHYSARTDVYGYTNGRGTIWVAQPTYDVGTPSAFMVNIVHEADHMRYGAHTCGEGADIDDNGTYGVDAYYSAKLFREATGLDGYMRYFASGNTVSIAYGNLCGNIEARNRVLNALDNGVFAPPPPRNPRGGGCRSGAVRYVC